jgi:hypothetical protein
VYYENVQYANEVNQQQGEEIFGETKFFDLTIEEFAAAMLNKIHP